MSFNKTHKKKVSFREVNDSSREITKRSNTKKTGILKINRNKKEKEDIKGLPQIEKTKKKEKIEIKIEEPINIKSDNDMKYLSADEYFRLTVQDALQEGLLNMAMVHPKNPIKFLGNYLIEKSKHSSIL